MSEQARSPGRPPEQASGRRALVVGDDPSAPRYVRTVRGIGYRMGEGT